MTLFSYLSRSFTVIEKRTIDDLQQLVEVFDWRPGRHGRLKSLGSYARLNPTMHELHWRLANIQDKTAIMLAMRGITMADICEKVSMLATDLSVRNPRRVALNPRSDFVKVQFSDCQEGLTALETTLLFYDQVMQPKEAR